MKMVSLHSCLLVASALPFLAPLLTIRADDSTILGQLGFRVHKFAFDLHKKISESKLDENIFFSPTSIYVALAMLYAGAGGETKSQLASALHLDAFKSDDDQFYKSIKLLLQKLDSSKKNYTLQIANRVFGQEGFNFKREYLKITDEYFRAEFQDLNFREDPSGSRSKINRWVAMMTSNKIEELFPQGTINSNTVLALANAVYFKSSWLKKFDERNTNLQTFYLPNSQEIEVPMMNLILSEKYNYYTSKTFACQVLELPYSDAKLSMVIILPNEVDGLSLLVERVRNNSKDGNSHSRRTASVKLSLPKFTLQPTLNLKESLQALGIVNLFGDADLSGIDDSRAFALSQAIHKAYIAVDEEGTEGAGATGIAIEPVSLVTDEVQPINFIVDRPFMFLVVEMEARALLFFGIIENPLKTN